MILLFPKPDVVLPATLCTVPKADSDRTAYKTWELPVLVLLVGAVMLERVGPSLEMDGRTLPLVEGGRVGAGTHLASAVTDVRRLLNAPREVSAALYRICTELRCLPDIRPGRRHQGRAHESLRYRGGAERREPHELRAMAREMINALRDAISADVLSADMAKDVALKDLLRRM